VERATALYRSTPSNADYSFAEGVPIAKSIGARFLRVLSELGAPVSPQRSAEITHESVEVHGKRLDGVPRGLTRSDETACSDRRMTASNQSKMASSIVIIA